LKNYLSKFQAKNQDIKPYEDSEFELLIDGYQDKDNIYIKAMIAGVKSSDLFISIGFDEITISGIRGRDLNLNTDNLFKQELKYGSFTRSIKLNEEIDIDEAKLEVKYGVLTLKLPKINKNRKRILKINY
jgi:HSP20 family protein